ISAAAHLNHTDEFVPAAQLNDAVGKQWRSLAYCARISRAFSAPALRLLWRELPSLIPLLSLGLSLVEDDDIWLPGRAAQPQGLQRLNHFAALVRRVSLPASEDVDSTVLFHLSRANLNQPLLPMVDGIKCTASPQLDMIILLLAGHSLRELIITTGAPWTSGMTPGLQSLCVYDTSTDGLRNKLRSLRLEFRSYEHWSSAFFQALAKLDHLSDLAYPRRLQNWRHPMQEGSLVIAIMDMAAFGSLAKVMPPIRLEYLDVVHAFADSFTEVHSHLDEFFTTCADTLSTVKLGVYSENGHRRGAAPFPVFNILRPLVRLHCLQVCTISVSRTLAFTDRDLRNVRGVWPHLQHPRSAGTAPSFDDIVDFLWECPRLTMFKLSAICIDGTPQSCTNLEALPPSLVVEDAHIRDPMAFADVLRGLFPAVRIAEVLNSAPSKWGIVLSRLRDTNKPTDL
ncbi:uncharacterized protein B0H18DRAFT_991754, partial [Fomitopsis serialis]|uniref:uncharacterized protein n=1 Tax=Fomitopsis serialis TaxID=139415 RepID=UPI002008C1FE